MPREFITDSNYSLLVLTVSWFTCAIAILGTVARAIAKIVFRRAFSLDDYSSSLSILLVIAQTVAVTIRTSNGLGKHVDTLVTSQVSAYLKVIRSVTTGYLCVADNASRLPMPITSCTSVACVFRKFLFSYFST